VQFSPHQPKIFYKHYWFSSLPKKVSNVDILLK